MEHFKDDFGGHFRPEAPLLTNLLQNFNSSVFRSAEDAAESGVFAWFSAIPPNLAQFLPITAQFLPITAHFLPISAHLLPIKANFCS